MVVMRMDTGAMQPKPADDASLIRPTLAARRTLAKVGQLPISETDRGFKISGYAA